MLGAPPYDPQTIEDILRAIATPDVGRWCPAARPVCIPKGSTTATPVYTGVCILIGALVRAGAAAATLSLFDQEANSPSGASTLTTDPKRELPGPKASQFDGWVNCPVYCERGIVAVIDQADAVGWVLFLPLLQQG